MFHRCVLAGFGLVLMGLFFGCETTDYEPLRFKKEIKDLKSEVAELRSEVEALKRSGVEVAPVVQPETKEPSTVQAPLIMPDPVQPPPPTRKTLSLAEEQQVVSELERIDVFFDFDDDGFAFEADFKDCRQQQDALARVVDFSRLRRVLLAGNDANDETFDFLSKITTLDYLDIERSVPSVESLEKLKQLPNLKFLQLLRATLTEDSFKVLAEFPSLEQIRCAQTRVGDAELKYLEKLDSLRAIDLSDCNRVTTRGLESLAKCPRLSFLKVWGKSIGNQSMDVVAKMKALRVLGMSDSAVNDEGILKLSPLSLREVQLTRTSVGDAGIEVLANMPDLEKMNIRDTAISDRSMGFISGLEKLVDLDVSECNSPGVTDAGLKEIAKLTTLTKLNLWSTKVTDAGVVDIAGMTNLVSLNLDNTEVTDQTAKLISEKMPQLTYLHLGKTKVTDEGVALLKNMSNLQQLILPATISDDVFYDLVDTLAENDCEVERSSL